MRKFVITAIVPLLIFASDTSLAQSSFEMTDDNNDGRISKNEFYVVIARAGVFETLDTNADGRIDEEELEAFDDEVALAWDLDEGEALDRRAFYNGVYRYIDEGVDGSIDTFEWNDPEENGWFGVYDAP